MIKYLPSIWLAEFHRGQDWTNASNELSEAQKTIDMIDDRMLVSRHPFKILGWCAACVSQKFFNVTWHYGGVNDGSINPAWTETAVCESCGLNSRMRALYRFLYDKCRTNLNGKVYLAEQITSFYKILRSKCSNVVGSEYLGKNTALGAKSLKGRHLVRNEDLTNLTFESSMFDLVITQDVFEHVPNFSKAFAECRRILKPEGQLVFSIPFFPNLASTRVRAELSPTGELTHISEPEYHGNPLGDASLCFQNFGWDVLDTLRSVGFSEAKATLYWGPWSGHIGTPAFIFSAGK